MRKILLVDDEPVMRQLIARIFIDHGYQVVEAENGKEALSMFAESDFDLVVLDVMMPVMDGWSVCRRIRENSQVLIIMLTARDDDEDKLLGYELGVDDYVTKPINARVLLAKSERLLERVTQETKEEKPPCIEAGGICVDRLAYQVTLDQEVVELAPKEYDLLIYLLENDGLVRTREMILNAVWGFDYYGDTRVVDTHIKKLRKKLAKKAKCIQTIVRTGYKFNSKVLE